MTEIIDEAAVRIVAEIDPAFGPKVRAAVAKALKGVDKQVKASMRPISRSIENGITDPIDRAAAKVTGAARAAGRGIAQGIESGAEKAAREIDQLAAKAEADLANIDARVSIDTATAQAQVRALVEKTQRELGRIEADVTLDPRKAQAKVNQLVVASQKRLDTLSANIGVKSATAEARVEALVTKTQRRLDTLSAKVDADTVTAQAQVDEFIARNSGRNINIDVDVDNAAASIGAAASRITTSLSAAQQSATEFGSTASGSIRGVTGALSALASAGPGGAAAIAAVAAVAAVAVAAGGALTAVAGAATIATAAILPLTAAVSSLGLAFAAVKVGSGGLGEALEEQAKAQEELARTGEVSVATQQNLRAAMENLSPAAREVATVLGSVRQAFDKVRLVVQEKLFDGLAGPLQRLGRTYLPVLQAGLGAVAKLLNRTIKGFIDFANRGSTVQAVAGVFVGLKDVLEDMLPAIGNVLRGLGNLFAGSLPGANRISDAFLGWSERFREFTERITNDGSFQRFIDRAITAAASIGRLFKSIGAAIGNVLNQGADTGVSIIDRMTGAFRDLNDYLSSEEGKKSLKSWFKLGESFAAAFGSVVRNTARAFRALGVVIQALEPILSPIIRLVGRFGNLVSPIAGLWMGIYDAVTDVWKAIRKIELPDWFTDLANSAVTTVLQGIVDGFTAIANAIDDLPGIPDWMTNGFDIPGFDLPSLKGSAGTFDAPDTAQALAGFRALREEYTKTASSLDKSDVSLGAFGRTLQKVDEIVNGSVSNAKIKELIAAGGALNSAFAGAPAAAQRFLGRIGPIINANVVTPMQVARGKVAENTSLTVEAFRKLPERVQKVLKTLGVNIVTPVSEATKRAREAAKAGITLTAAEFAKLPPHVKEVLKNLGVIIKDNVKQGMDAGENETRAGRERMRKEAAKIKATLGAATRGAADLVGDNIRAGFNGAVGRTRTGVGDVGRAAGTLAGKIRNAVNPIQSILFGVGGWFSDLASQISANIDNIRADINRLPSRAREQALRNFARGDIVTRETFARIGEAGPEAVIPLLPSLSSRSLYLLKQSGLLDRPDVQKAVAQKVPATSSPVDRVFTNTTRTSTLVVDKTETKQTVYNTTNNFSLAAGPDPNIQAVQILNRLGNLGR